MKTFLLLILTFFGTTEILSAQGKLSEMESSSSSSSSTTTTTSVATDNNDFYFYGGGANFLMNTFELFFGFHWEEPAFRSLKNGGRSFTKHPYALGQYGKYAALGDEHKAMSAEIRAAIFAEDIDLYGTSFYVRLSPHRAFSLFGQQTVLYETLDNAPNDKMVLTSAGAYMNRIRKPQFDLYWGIGVFNMKREESNTSLSYLMGSSFYFKKPISIHWDGEFSNINNSFVAINQLRMQYHIKQPFIYLAYRNIRINRVNINAIVAGAGISF